MMAYIDPILTFWSQLVIWAAAFFVIFTLLARYFPCNATQPVWRHDILTDILYMFILPVLNRFASIGFIMLGAYLVFYGQPAAEAREYLRNGYGPASALPIWLQAALIVIISDVILYWIHRGFHGRRLWRYHAIHHSPEHVDWMSAYRFHPVNTWFSFALVDAAMILAGFSPAAIAAMAVANTIYSVMVHANLNWTFGPFKYVFASPVFHRWHHTGVHEGGDRNFAPTFPLIDVVFGTFYMPEGKLPEKFGVQDNAIPPGFLRQMAWPFQRQQR